MPDLRDACSSVLLTLLALTSTAVVACDDPAASQSERCAQAADHVRTCFGTELDACDDAVADALLSQSCDAITASARPAEKADGGYCPGFLWFLCGDSIESRWQCPTARPKDGYEFWDGSDRMSYHWAWMLCTEYGIGNNPEYDTAPWDLLMNATQGVFSSALSLDRSFDNTTDELDAGRVKLIHPYGTAAKVALLLHGEADPSCDMSLSGVLSEERVTGLARLGWGAPPLIGYIPGMGLKLFVDGQPSVNLHLLESLDPTPDANFFHAALTNVLPEPKGVALRALGRYFEVFVDDALHLRLEHLARQTSDGEPVPSDERSAPYRLTFAPGADVEARYAAALEADPDADFREIFDAIPEGAVLYEVHAQVERGGCEAHIGRLVTTSRFVASAWSDERLYFQHAREGQGLD